MDTDKTTSSKHIKLSTNTIESDRLYDFLSESLYHLFPGDKFLHDIKLVSEEVLVNIINHGSDISSDEFIDVQLTVDEHSVHLTFIDSGKEFNPLEQSAANEPKDLSQGGMGLVLIKALTDEQVYIRDMNLNKFTVTKIFNR